MSLEQNKGGNGGSDPTMEEILASIRRIIAEDNEPKPDATPVVTDGTPPEPEPEPQPVEQAAPRVKRNVLELTEMVAEDGSVVSLPGRTDAFDDEIEGEEVAPVAAEAESDPFADVAFAAAEPAAAPPAASADDDPFGNVPSFDSAPAAPDDFAAAADDDGFAKIDEDSLPAIDDDDDFASLKADDDFFASGFDEEPEAPPPPKPAPVPAPAPAAALADDDDDFGFAATDTTDTDDDFDNSEASSFPSFEIGDVDMVPHHEEPAVAARDPEPEPELQPAFPEDDDEPLFAAEPIAADEELELAEPVFTLPVAVPPPMTPPQPAAVPSAAGRQEVRPDMTRDQLISEPAAALTRNAFNQVAQAMQAEQMARNFASNSRTIEQMAEELLTPMLKEWLDNNLAALVERLVSEEIARIAGRASSV